MVSDDGWPEHAAKLLGGEAWPDGKDWRCVRCGYVCGDDGPDRCPNDDTPLMRNLLTVGRNA